MDAGCVGSRQRDNKPAGGTRQQLAKPKRHDNQLRFEEFAARHNSGKGTQSEAVHGRAGGMSIITSAIFEPQVPCRSVVLVDAAYGLVTGDSTNKMSSSPPSINAARVLEDLAQFRSRHALLLVYISWAIPKLNVPRRTSMYSAVAIAWKLGAE